MGVPSGMGNSTEVHHKGDVPLATNVAQGQLLIKPEVVSPGSLGYVEPFFIDMYNIVHVVENGSAFTDERLAVLHSVHFVFISEDRLGRTLLAYCFTLFFHSMEGAWCHANSCSGRLDGTSLVEGNSLQPFQLFRSILALGTTQIVPSANVHVG